MEREADKAEIPAIVATSSPPSPPGAPRHVARRPQVIPGFGTPLGALFEPRDQDGDIPGALRVDPAPAQQPTAHNPLQADKPLGQQGMRAERHAGAFQTIRVAAVAHASTFACICIATVTASFAIASRFDGRIPSKLQSLISSSKDLKA